MDEIKPCVFCSEEILITAKLCKHCGRFQDANKNSGMKLKTLGVFILILVAFFSGKLIFSPATADKPVTNNLSVYLDFNDQGIVEVLKQEIYYSYNNELPGQTLYFTCSQEATDSLVKIFNGSMSDLPFGTIESFKSGNAKLLKSDSSLLAISDSSTSQIGTEHNCSLLFEFKNVMFDGLPFTFDLSEYGVDPIVVNPNEITNSEIHIKLHKITFKSHPKF